MIARCIDGHSIKDGKWSMVDGRVALVGALPA